MWKNIAILLLASALAGLLLVHPDVLLVHRKVELPSVESSPPASPNPITTLLHEAHTNPSLTGTAIGFCLLNTKGEVVLDENATTAFIPASSLKTLTTATALEILGPDFHFTTALKSTAPIQSGTIQGDLLIIGGGDPMLKLDDLKAWATELKKRGLTRITGGIRTDATSRGNWKPHKLCYDSRPSSGWKRVAVRKITAVSVFASTRMAEEYPRMIANSELMPEEPSCGTCGLFGGEDLDGI